MPVGSSSAMVQYGTHSAGILGPVALTVTDGNHVGLRGLDRRRMPASTGVRSAFARLHGRQQDTTFSQVVRPPRDFGTTWSKLKSSDMHRVPQYWQCHRAA